MSKKKKVWPLLAIWLASALFGYYYRPTEVESIIFVSIMITLFFAGD